MKKKYLYQIILALIVLVIIAPTCLGSDEEEEEEDRPYYEEMIVGTWNLDNVSIRTSDGNNYYFTLDSLDYSAQLNVYENLTYRYTTYFQDSNEVDTGELEITETQVRVYSDNYMDQVFNYYLNNSSLTIMYTDTLYLAEGERKYGEITEEYIKQ